MSAQPKHETPTLPVLTYEQFRKLYKATRNFQRYSHTDRADIAASHRMGHRQREAIGEFIYTHDLCPDRAFDTAQQATRSAYDAYLVSVEGKAELLAALKDLVQADTDMADPGLQYLALERACEVIKKIEG